MAVDRAQLFRTCVEQGFRMAGREFHQRMRERSLRRHLPPGWGSGTIRPAQRAHAHVALAQDTLRLAADTEDQDRRAVLEQLAAGDLTTARDALAEVGGGVQMRTESDRIRRAIARAERAGDPAAAARSLATARAQTARLVVEGCAADAAEARGAAEPDAQLREYADWVRDTRPSTEEALARLQEIARRDQVEAPA